MPGLRTLKRKKLFFKNVRFFSPGKLTSKQTRKTKEQHAAVHVKPNITMQMPCSTTQNVCSELPATSKRPRAIVNNYVLLVTNRRHEIKKKQTFRYPLKETV